MTIPLTGQGASLLLRLLRGLTVLGFLDMHHHHNQRLKTSGLLFRE